MPLLTSKLQRKLLTKKRRGIKSSVGHEHHLGFRPTAICVPSLSSVIIIDLFANTHCSPSVSVLPGEVDVGAPGVPPSSGESFCTMIVAPSILVSVPGRKVRRRVRLFLFIFCLSPRAELLPIVVFH